MHHTEAGPGPKGSVLAVTFEIDGQAFIALDGGPQCPFTPASSRVVHCGAQEDVARHWAQLDDGGREVLGGVAPVRLRAP
ncbi:VOC family protein, partial [Paraburkholderia ginsengiterrae]